MKYIFAILCCVAFFLSNAKAQDASRLHEMGKNYLVDGDYSNAESLLQQAYDLDTNNLVFIKDLTLCYYFQKAYNSALNTIKKTIESETADDQCFQIAGNIYKALNQLPACELVYKKGLKKYPENGAFYNELGELLSLQNNNECIDYWEKGIEFAPAYSRNYYNASKYYANSKELVWCMLYAEIFINMEPSNNKTPEIKDILFTSYQKLFESFKSEGGTKDKNKFVQKILNHLNNQNKIAAQSGLTTTSLTMIRTRFILDWYNDKPEKFPFQLFDYQQQLLKSGMFEAYNQWLLGSSENLVNFQNWTQFHSQEYNAFIKYLRAQPFAMPKGQYYF
jgi:tetratricopeptide (TPR) repeat protein